ncbi:hypothetical protein Tco_1009946 [Tanacetum coccineum]
MVCGLRLAFFSLIAAEKSLACVCYESRKLPKQSQPSIVFTAFSAIDGGAGFCVLSTGKVYRGNGEVGNGMGRAGKCTREVVWPRNHGRGGGWFWR